MATSKAYTLSAAELKRSIEAPSDEAPRSIPLIEREEGQAAQVARLRGLDCEGENEPSHTLIDKAFSSFSKNQLAKIEWKDVPSCQCL